MTVERTYRCDGPDCEHNWSEGVVKGRCPGLLTVVESGPEPIEFHFCGWDCCLKYAARFEPPERVELGGEN